MPHTPGPWRVSEKVGGTVVADYPMQTEGRESGHNHREYYGGYCVAESIFENNLSLIASAPEMRNQLDALAEIIARNLTAWDTSKDKTHGQLPWVYLENKTWYKKLTGEDYVFHKAVKKFNIGGNENE